MTPISARGDPRLAEIAESTKTTENIGARRDIGMEACSRTFCQREHAHRRDVVVDGPLVDERLKDLAQRKTSRGVSSAKGSSRVG